MSDKWGPLPGAIEIHDSEAVEALLAEGSIDLNVEDPVSRSLPLQHAIDVEIDGFVQSLLQPRFDIVQLLLAAGADPHCRDRDGESAIDMARRSRNHQLLSILAEATGEDLRM
jgi:ankyrin repeat protein